MLVLLCAVWNTIWWELMHLSIHVGAFGGSVFDHIPYPESVASEASGPWPWPVSVAFSPVCRAPRYVIACVHSARRLRLAGLDDTWQPASSIHSEWNRIESWMHTSYSSASPSRHATCTIATMTVVIIRTSTVCRHCLKSKHRPPRSKRPQIVFVVVTSQPS